MIAHTFQPDPINHTFNNLNKTICCVMPSIIRRATMHGVPSYFFSLKHFSKLMFTVKRGSNYSLDDFSKWLTDFDHLMTATLHSLTVMIINYAV